MDKLYIKCMYSIPTIQKLIIKEIMNYSEDTTFTTQNHETSNNELRLCLNRLLVYIIYGLWLFVI